MLRIGAGRSILTNLVPLALVIAMLAVVQQHKPSNMPPQPERRGARWRLVAATTFTFALGLLPGCAAVAILQKTLYGSAALSGYGPLSTLFKWEWAAANLRHYPRWLLELHSAGLLFAAVAFVPSRASVEGADTDHRCSPSVVFLLALYCLFVLACYVFYIPFDGWPFMRFLLPAIPVLFVLAAKGALNVVDCLPVTTRNASLLAMCTLVAASYLNTAHRLGVFFVREDQSRFRTIGTYLGRVLPPNAVVFAGLHSGSVRLYGNRLTVRWTQLRSEDLDAAVALVVANGYSPYLLAESDEEKEFRQRFRPFSPFGALDWAPTYQYTGHIGARVYSLTEQTRGSLPQPIPPDF
jgi:hypothetical protein